MKITSSSIFRFDFFYSIFTTLIFSCGIPMFQFFIYNKTNGYVGWNFEEILLFQAVLLLTLGINETLFGEIKLILEQSVQQGLFDRLLLYPHSALTMLIARGFSYRSLGTLLAGIVCTAYVLIRYQLVASLWGFLFFLVFLFVGILFRLTFTIFYCALTLRFIYFERAKEVIDKFLTFGSFPAEIYSGFFQLVYLTVIPIAVAVYFPVRSLLGKLDVYAFIGAGVSILLFLLSLLFWNVQIKNYTSAGG